MGTAILHLGPNEFAIANVVLTLAWLGVALRLLRPASSMPSLAIGPLGRAGVATAALLLLVSGSASAQDSRAEALAAARAEKAANLHPYEPSALERRVELANRLMSANRTFYPFIGGVYEGGGLAVGPGFRRTFADSGLISAHAAWSIRSYGAAVGSVAFPAFGDGRVRVSLQGQRLHAPRVAFYGLGNRSRRADRRTFGYDETTVGTTATVSATDLFSVGGGFDFLKTAADGDSDATALSLDSFDATYARSRVFAQLDSRTSPGYTRRGGLYRAELADYRQSNETGREFQRADVEVQQFVPLFNESSVIALRGTATATLAATGQDVPYFLMPSLGGHDALRGYSSWRFRDRNRLLMTAEYRWAAGPLVDMALFVDAGQVAPRVEDFSASDLRASYGVGFSVHTPNATVTRFELARSREGLGLLISFGPSF